MSPNKPYKCEKCQIPITKAKITRRRAQKPVYHHVPILKYTYCPIQQQLQDILARPGISEAIKAHREYLKREGKSPGALEDIQDGEIWQNFKKGDSYFFDDPNNIGLILMCDWYTYDLSSYFFILQG